MTEMLATDVREDFLRKGYTVLPGFYDVEADIAPIQEGIRHIVALLCDKYGVDAPTATPFEAMTRGYPALLAGNRAWASEVYDAVKHIPGLLRLVSKRENDDLFHSIRHDSIPGIATGGYGIRIDNPGEERYRSHWHQEFPSQLRSRDGIIFWTPLLPVTPELGPVEIAAGSHAEGAIPVYYDDKGVGATGAYTLHLDGAEERLSRYDKVAPLPQPGDLILMDFMTLHQSGRNVAAYPRWSIQFRLFNYADPLGIRIGWAGSYAAGTNFADILPELVARRES